LAAAGSTGGVKDGDDAGDRLGVEDTGEAEVLTVAGVELFPDTELEPPVHPPTGVVAATTTARVRRM